MAAGDQSIIFGTEVKPTFSVASLATSSTLLAGYQSSIIDNSSDLWTDFLVSGRVTVGTTPTTNTFIELWAFSQIEDTPIYPDSLDGSAGAKTLNSEGIKNSGLALVAGIFVDSTTTDRPYPIKPVSVRSLFGAAPKRFGFWLTHSTGVNLNATAGNHFLSVLPTRGRIATS